MFPKFDETVVEIQGTISYLKTDEQSPVLLPIADSWLMKVLSASFVQCSFKWRAPSHYFSPLSFKVAY